MLQGNSASSPHLAKCRSMSEPRQAASPCTHKISAPPVQRPLLEFSWRLRRPACRCWSPACPGIAHIVSRWAGKSQARSALLESRLCKLAEGLSSGRAKHADAEQHPSPHREQLVLAAPAHADLRRPTEKANMTQQMHFHFRASCELLLLLLRRTTSTRRPPNLPLVHPDSLLMCSDSTSDSGHQVGTPLHSKGNEQPETRGLLLVA